MFIATEKNQSLYLSNSNPFPALPLSEEPSSADRVNRFFQKGKNHFFAWTESFKGKNISALIAKSVVSSISLGLLSYLCYGTLAMMAGGAIPFAFYASTKCDRSWLSPDDFRRRLAAVIFIWAPATIFIAAIVNAIVRRAITTFLIFNDKADSSQLPNQLEHKKAIKTAVEKGQEKSLYTEFCIIGPIVEEILFRGFLMDVLFYAQSKWNLKTVDSANSKAARIGLQALIFGTMHYIPSQKLSNYSVVATTAVFGICCGYIQEKTSNIALPWITHAAQNFLYVRSKIQALRR